MIFIIISSLLLLSLACAQKDMELMGVGASLPVEVYEAWAPAFENYRNQFVSLDNEYYAIGMIFYVLLICFLRPVKLCKMSCLQLVDHKHTS